MDTSLPNDVKEPVPSTHLKRKYLWYGLVVLFVVLLVASFFFFKSDEKVQVDVLDNQSSASASNPSPTPDPFDDMTIPYLSARNYSSQLGALELISSNGIYSSYLTSFDSDGLRVNGLLTVPDEEMPEGGWPAIVFIHGYIPPSIYQTTSNYADYVDYLARRGFVVFKIDLRGHAQSEGDASGAYYSGDYIVDALNARAALSAFDQVDPDAIGLWGHSMAGNVVFRAMASSDTPAGVIWAGAVYTYEDMQEFGIDDNSYRPPSDDSPRRQERNRLRELHGSFNAADPFWQKVPATNYLENITGAIQINHAVDDSVVSVGYSRNLQELLSDTEITFELQEYPSGGHNISGGNFVSAMQNTADFFHKHLK